MRRVYLSIIIALLWVAAITSLVRAETATAPDAQQTTPGSDGSAKITVTCGSASVTGPCFARCIAHRNTVTLLVGLDTDLFNARVYTVYPGVEIGEWGVEICPWAEQNGRCVNTTCNEMDWLADGPSVWGSVTLRRFDWGGQGRLRIGTFVTLPVGGYPMCDRLRVVSDDFFPPDPPIPTCHGQNDEEMGGYGHGFYEVGGARRNGDMFWWYRSGPLHVSYDIVAYPVGVMGCNEACQSSESGDGMFAIQCASGLLSGTWFITHTRMFNIVALCTAQQGLLFDRRERIQGHATPKPDLLPLGLSPFNNNRYLSVFPLDALTVAYSSYLPQMRGTVTETASGTLHLGTLYLYEAWTIDFRAISFTLPFTVPVCAEPKSVAPRCQQPPSYLHIGTWIQWLWCKLKYMYHTFIGEWRYYVCLILAALYRVGNAYAYTAYNIYADTADILSQLAEMFAGYDKRFAAFVIMTVNEWSDWLGGLLIWIAGWVNASMPGFARFLLMSVSEFAPWLSEIFVWFVEDFTPMVFGQILELLALIINNSSTLAQLVVTLFSETLRRAIGMLLFSLQMLTYMLTLASDLITGLREALSSDTSADLFKEAAFFWRGLDYFDGVIGETPLAIMNMFAIGLIAVNLLYWTLGQIGGIVDDMINV